MRSFSNSYISQLMFESLDHLPMSADPQSRRETSDSVSKAPIHGLPLILGTTIPSFEDEARGTVVVRYLGQLLSRRRRRIEEGIQSRLTERILERERIARELHDTLLQDFEGVILRLNGEARKLAVHDPVRHSIEKTLDLADQTLIAGRNRVRDLRETGWDGETLAAKLEKLCEGLKFNHVGDLRVCEVGVTRNLNVVVRDELFFIFREALLNASRHSRCTQVECVVTYERRGLLVKCQDNGCGIPPNIMRSYQVSNHWGLVGMQERSAALGALFSLKSDAQTGTCIVVRVPARIAYS